MLSGCFMNRNEFSSDHALVHGHFPVEDDAIHGYCRSPYDHDDVIRTNASNGCLTDRVRMQPRIETIHEIILVIVIIIRLMIIMIIASSWYRSIVIVVIFFRCATKTTRSPRGCACCGKINILVCFPCLQNCLPTKKTLLIIHRCYY